MDLRWLFGETTLEDDGAEPVPSPDMSEFGVPSPTEGHASPPTGAVGPPSYPDLSEFEVAAPEEAARATQLGRPKYPSLNMDLADRWIVVRVDSSKMPPGKPSPKWAKQDPGPVSEYGLMPADEADRWGEWYGPYSYKVAQDVVKDLQVVREIMDR